MTLREFAFHSLLYLLVHLVFPIPLELLDDLEDPGKIKLNIETKYYKSNFTYKLNKCAFLLWFCKYASAFSDSDPGLVGISIASSDSIILTGIPGDPLSPSAPPSPREPYRKNINIIKLVISYRAMTYVYCKMFVVLTLFSWTLPKDLVCRLVSIFFPPCFHCQDLLFSNHLHGYVYF